jgi:hypothetical protein
MTERSADLTFPNTQIENSSVLRAVRVAVSVLLLLAVTSIFLLPSVDLDPTTLRAARFSALLFMAIVAGASVLNSLLIPLHSPLGTPVGSSPPLTDLIDFTCSRLC